LFSGRRWGCIRVVMDKRLAAALALLEAWAALYLSCIDFWWSTMVNGVPSRRESARMAVHTLEMV